MAAHLGLEWMMGQNRVFGISENNVDGHVTGSKRALFFWNVWALIQHIKHVSETSKLCLDVSRHDKHVVRWTRTPVLFGHDKQAKGIKGPVKCSVG
jgi:hypothetical protein